MHVYSTLSYMTFSGVHQGSILAGVRESETPTLAGGLLELPQLGVRWTPSAARAAPL